EDHTTGQKIAVELSRLRGPIDWKYDKTPGKLLEEVRTRLGGKLQGTFLLLAGFKKIKVNQKNWKSTVEQLCQQVMTHAPCLAEGQETTLHIPFECTLRKMKTQGSTLGVEPPFIVHGFDPDMTRKQLEETIDEANEKFKDYSDLLTIVLLGIWETGVEYDAFAELLPGIDMNRYKNVEHVYLYDAAPDTWIYRLWPLAT
ncbi:MAG: hypothetical protein V3R87_10555, partial [Dehalococcoidia bacterium]